MTKRHVTHRSEAIRGSLSPMFYSTRRLITRINDTPTTRSRNGDNLPSVSEQSVNNQLDMEVQYDLQIHTIGQKAEELNLDLQEVSDYYYARYAEAQRSCSHPQVPPIYHQFLAERETWTYYFEGEFPGKDPLYECFVAVLSQSETNHTRRIEQLEVALQQMDLIIHSKDDLLNIKKEILLANRALMSSKDDIIKAWASTEHTLATADYFLDQGERDPDRNRVGQGTREYNCLAE
ncbi:hypothetical protein F5882DRAFT_39595 [Hyaloscypha sp. PMI_1271]|nr:hypothetical protein F5882DRAFT_39595 [Hyaloscypha sp. PMI_1271]